MVLSFPRVADTSPGPTKPDVDPTPDFLPTGIGPIIFNALPGELTFTVRLTIYIWQPITTLIYQAPTTAGCKTHITPVTQEHSCQHPHADSDMSGRHLSPSLSTLVVREPFPRSRHIVSSGYGAYEQPSSPSGMERTPRHELEILDPWIQQTKWIFGHVQPRRIPAVRVRKPSISAVDPVPSRIPEQRRWAVIKGYPQVFRTILHVRFLGEHLSTKHVYTVRASCTP